MLKKDRLTNSIIIIKPTEDKLLLHNFITNKYSEFQIGNTKIQKTKRSVVIFDDLKKRRISRVYIRSNDLESIETILN
jgi:putative heme degradation protein